MYKKRDGQLFAVFFAWTEGNYGTEQICSWNGPGFMKWNEFVPGIERNGLFDRPIGPAGPAGPARPAGPAGAAEAAGPPGPPGHPPNI